MPILGILLWAGIMLSHVSAALPQLDKATADAAEFKAGFDKLVVDAVEHKAQVGGWTKQVRWWFAAHLAITF